MALRLAVLAPEEYDLEVEGMPLLRGVQVLDRGLDFVHVARLPHEPPALREAVDVRVHRKGRDPKGLRHEHARGLVAHPGQRLELRKGAGDLAAVPLHQETRHRHQVLGLGGGKADLPDDSLDLPHVRGRHLLRGPRVPEERRRDFVDLLVGALGAHHHRTQELEEVGVRERDNGFGVELRQLAADALGAVLQVLAQVRCPRALPGSVHGPGGN
mmetsp:Transcript_25861/g.82279  ORF Transcript_25861/g.82279 Transcript_25861/m.82279 type:complete len:214 (+) Transcript_25861:1840-2481(+)